MPSCSFIYIWKSKDIRLCNRRVRYCKNVNWNDKLRVDTHTHTVPSYNSLWTSSSVHRIGFIEIIMLAGCVNSHKLKIDTLPAMIYRFKDVSLTRNCRLHKSLINIIICAYFPVSHNDTCNLIHVCVEKS